MLTAKIYKQHKRKQRPVQYQVKWKVIYLQNFSEMFDNF